MTEDLNFAYAGGGRIEVICGCMFSGKTEELIRRLRRSEIARQRIRIFKPAVDNRYSPTDIVSHDTSRMISIPVNKPEEILEHAEDADVVGIDEVQFFDGNLPAIIQKLAGQGKRIILAGLDMDYRGRPFGIMPELLSCAESVTKLQAICQVCAKPASYSYRKAPDYSKILVGAKESYEARCRECFQTGQQA